MFDGSPLSENLSKRDSKKRRRVSERRRLFNRLGVTSDPGLNSDRRRSSNLPGGNDRPDSPVLAGLAAANDQTKITMKIQFHITLAPDNEPLILDYSNNLISQQQQQQQQKRQLSNESNSFISEVIGDRLNRLNSSTRKRQQLLAMHQQAAMDGKNGPAENVNGRQYSVARQHSVRSGSFSATSNLTSRANDSGASREGGARSSTITDGIQDERTMRFLRNKQQQLRQTSGSLTSNSASSLLGQHQTLMASSNNIRQRLEQREHIYFKRDGQRFGHEFTLKLAVDRTYRCLLKVRPLIPLQSISIHGHHVSFVDCSQSAGSSGGSLGDSPLSMHSMGINFSDGLPGSPATGPLNTAASNLNASSGQAEHTHSWCATPKHLQRPEAFTTRHQSIGGPLISGGINHQHHLNGNNSRARLLSQGTDMINHQRQKNQVTSGGNKTAAPNGNASNQNCHADNQHQNSISLTSLGGQHFQKQLIKQQQHNQMLRHFSASHGSNSHLGSQLVYMFDWSAGRFEVTKNKARTTVQTVLKFKNGEMLSLPLQIKFYQPECRQHLSWGSQLHFIDYECQINSMGQISVDRVQYY